MIVLFLCFLLLLVEVILTSIGEFKIDRKIRQLQEENKRLQTEITILKSKQIGDDNVAEEKTWEV